MRLKIRSMVTCLVVAWMVVTVIYLASLFWGAEPEVVREGGRDVKCVFGGVDIYVLHQITYPTYTMHIRSQDEW